MKKSVSVGSINAMFWVTLSCASIRNILGKRRKLFRKVADDMEIRLLIILKISYNFISQTPNSKVSIT